MTARPHVLVVNAGSSSLKYQLIDASSGLTVAVGLVSEIGGASRHRHEVDGVRHERGLDCPDHGEICDSTKRAIENFQAQNKLDVTGEINDALKNKLKEFTQ